MAGRATIGLRAHSGWAAAVALAGSADAPVVVMRRRIEMKAPGAAGLSQPYHAAVGLELRDAERVVREAAARASQLATAGLRLMVADLKALGHAVDGCGLLLASGRGLPGLEKILASHALIHTAEGELFREALRSGCAALGLPVICVKEREVLAGSPGLEARMAAMGKAIGPPWRQDEKLAAAAAWVAMASLPT